MSVYSCCLCSSSLPHHLHWLGLLFAVLYCFPSFVCKASAHQFFFFSWVFADSGEPLRLRLLQNYSFEKAIWELTALTYLRMVSLSLLLRAEDHFLCHICHENVFSFDCKIHGIVAPFSSPPWLGCLILTFKLDLSDLPATHQWQCPFLHSMASPVARFSLVICGSKLVQYFTMSFCFSERLENYLLWPGSGDTHL